MEQRRDDIYPARLAVSEELLGEDSQGRVVACVREGVESLTLVRRWLDS
jgi:hypothetical protein